MLGTKALPKVVLLLWLFFTCLNSLIFWFLLTKVLDNDTVHFYHAGDATVHLAKCKICKVTQVILISKRLFCCWTKSTDKKKGFVTLSPKRDSVRRSEKTVV